MSVCLSVCLDLANSNHPTIKFTAEISDTEITFLDTHIYIRAKD